MTQPGESKMEKKQKESAVQAVQEISPDEAFLLYCKQTRTWEDDVDNAHLVTAPDGTRKLVVTFHLFPRM